MRPVMEKKRLEVRYIVYVIILVVCIIAIGIAVYNQFFKDEKLGIILGITSEEEDEELLELKEDFLTIFDNNISVVEEYSGNVEKIKKEEDMVLIAYDVQEQEENYTVDLKIPYFNINTSVTKTWNQEIKSTFRDKLESIVSDASSNVNVIYNVKYKAYVKGDILSLVILSELKEGDSSERIIIQTYNYNLKEDREVTISEILEEKGIDVNEANDRIAEEVNDSQKQNIQLAELGYNVTVRDTTSSTYEIENAEQFFIGENGYLYVVYAYGNTEFTSEMDVVIFR